MKESIEYYYNLYIGIINEKDGIYNFKIDNNDYYFTYVKRTDLELSLLNDIIFLLKEKYILINEIVPNINNSYITYINDSKYILLKVYNPQEEISIPEMIEFSRKTVVSKYDTILSRISWGELWQAKVDYIENQINEIFIDNIIISSIDYYIGLTENAIYYYNTIINKFPNKYENITVCHQRVGYPNYRLNYYNPMQFIIDYNVRDIAEYIKSMFFSGEDALAELKSYLSINKLNTFSYNLLYVRLLYPSYYYDAYEKIVNDKKSSTILIDIISKNHEYELFLKNAYLLINNYAPLETINWIIY